MRLRTVDVLAVICVFVLASLPSYAADVDVNCSEKKHKQTIQGALNSLGKQGPHTITVSGTCNESVLIDGFDTLTLVSTTGASINDPTPADLEDNDVVDIVQSRNVTLQGFTINGGSSGIACFQFSVCYLRELTVQGQSGTGVSFGRSGGFVDNTTIQNTLFGGISVAQKSSVVFGSNVFGTPGTATIQDNGTADNGGSGAQVANGSDLTLAGATIQNHPHGDGVSVSAGSVLRLLNSTITGSGGNGINGNSSVLRVQAGAGPTSITNNGASGVNLASTSTMQSTTGPNSLTITGNGGNGIFVGHLSFLSLAGARTISGNGSPDVNCSVSTAKTVGTGGSGTPNLGGGTTNCTEPAP